MNLSEIVDPFADDMPEHTALVFGERTISYGQLRSSIDKTADALAKAGIGKGDRVVLLMGNRPEFVFGYFAALRLGAVAVTLNPVSTAFELSHYFTETKPAAVLATENPLPKLDALQDRSHVERLKFIASVEPAEGTVSFDEIEKDFSDNVKTVDCDPDDPAVIIFTAGLLGRALGATLSHRNLAGNSIMLRDQCGGTPEEHGLALIPLFHAFGAAVNMLNIFLVGGTVYLVERVDFPTLVPWLQKARITFTGMVPMAYYGLIYHPACRNLDLSSLRIAISGGATLPMEIYKGFCERYGIDLYQGYGLTEASPVVSWNNVNIPNKPATIGVPIPEVETEIHDENGNPLPPDTEGELVVRGPTVMLGYYGREAETRTVIRDGWLYTGDLGRIDPEGYITLTGLKKDLIITSGFNVYCQEVEEILIRHPQVADVALVGVPDLMRGEVIDALVVAESGTEPQERDIIRFCREYLSRYKCPRKVTLVQEIIRDRHGKPERWN